MKISVGICPVIGIGYNRIYGKYEVVSEERTYTDVKHMIVLPFVVVLIYKEKMTKTKTDELVMGLSAEDSK